MIRRLFLVKCPKCGNNMQMITSHLGEMRKIKKYSYSTKEYDLNGKRIRKIKEVMEPVRIMKRCFFCNNLFCIHTNVNNSNIVKEIKKFETE